MRAAAHIHSEWSYHATWPLRSIAKAFARRGFDLLLMAEHDRGFNEARWRSYQRACADASDERIRLVPGIEYEDPENIVHVTVWGERTPFIGESRPTLDVLRAARAEGAVAILAHPWRRDAFSRYRPEWAEFLTGVEVWNRQYDGVAPSRNGMRFAERESLAPFASLDFHTRRQFFPLAMRLDVEGPVDTTAIIRALEARRFRPELLGIPVAALTDGLPAATLRITEIGRRALRAPARMVTGRFKP